MGDGLGVVGLGSASEAFTGSGRMLADFVRALVSTLFNFAVIYRSNYNVACKMTVVLVNESNILCYAIARNICLYAVLIAVY